MENLSQALRLAANQQVAIVGAGGKSTVLFRIARELRPRSILATSTHLGSWQLGGADAHHIVFTQADVESALSSYIQGSLLFTGALDEARGRTRGLSTELLNYLHRRSMAMGVPLIIEADGSRRLPLKAPAEHEPLIPSFVDAVIVVAGLSGLMQPLSDDTVYGSERFGKIAGRQSGDFITIEDVERVLLDPTGGLKGIPAGSRKIALLNQADTPGLRREAQSIVNSLLKVYDAVGVTSLGFDEEQTSLPQIGAVYERCAAIVLAAGAATRMGSQKMLLPWRGEAVVRAVVRAAYSAGVQKVIIVTGAETEQVQSSVVDFPVEVVHNPRWEEGQGTSVAAGTAHVPLGFGSALYLLGDQPLVSAELIRSIYERHAQMHSEAVAPFVGDRRGNPVLFDKIMFPHLEGLRGEIGGRQLLAGLQIEKVQWEDENIFFDIDTPDDYSQLQAIA